MPSSTLNQNVTKDHSLNISVPTGGSSLVTNVSGATIFYADSPGVSQASNQGNLTAGQSATFLTPTWLCSAGVSQVSVLSQPAPSGGLTVREGPNAKQGVTAAMASGSVTVANTSVTPNSRVQVTRAPGGANPGAVYVSAIVPGTSFTVTSTSATDTGTVFFEIFEPA